MSGASPDPREPELPPRSSSSGSPKARATFTSGEAAHNALSLRVQEYGRAQRLAVDEAPPSGRDQDAYAERTAAALRALRAPDWDGPAVESMSTVARFVEETFIHSRDVAVLSSRMGGAAQTHDLVENARVADVRALADELGDEAPAWLRRLVAEAQRRQLDTIDVSKLSPYVIAGLARSGSPDPVAMRLHRLSAHHVGGMGVETAADVVNAMRMLRLYRQQPMSFAAVTAIVRDWAERDKVTAPELERLLAACKLQEQLEAEGAVTRY